MKNVLIEEIMHFKERFIPKTIQLIISGDVLNLFAAERPQQFHQVADKFTTNINICTPFQISFDPPYTQKYQHLHLLSNQS